MKPFNKSQEETFNRLEKEFLEYERGLENDRFNKILSGLPPERRADASLKTQGFHAGGEKPAEFHTSDVQSISSYSAVKNHLSNNPDDISAELKGQMDGIEKNFSELADYRHKKAFYSFVKERGDYLSENLGLDAEQKDAMLSTANALGEIYTDNINRIEEANKEALDKLPKPPPEAGPDYELKPPESTVDNPLSKQAQNEAVFSFRQALTDSMPVSPETYMTPGWQPQMGQMGQPQMGQMWQPQTGQPEQPQAGGQEPSFGFGSIVSTLTSAGIDSFVGMMVRMGILPPVLSEPLRDMLGELAGLAPLENKRRIQQEQMQQQMYQQQLYQQQMYQQPMYQQPMYQQPMYQQPMYQQPMYQQPMYQQPMYQQPMYQQPMQQQPMQQQPVYQQPMQQQPVYQQPMQQQPVYQQPMQQQPMQQQPVYQQPIQQQPTQPQPQSQFTIGNDSAHKIQSDLINRAMNIEGKQAVSNDMKAFFADAGNSDFSTEKVSGLKGLENPDTRLGLARSFMLSKGMSLDEIYSQSPDAMDKKSAMGKELDGILKSGDPNKIGKMYSDMSDALLKDELSTFNANLNDRSTYPKEYGKWHILNQSAKMFNDTLGVNMNNADDFNNVINKGDKNLSAYFEMAKNEEFGQRLKGIDALNKTVGPFYEMMGSVRFSSANSDKLDMLSDNFKFFDTTIKEKRKTGDAKAYGILSLSERSIANDMAKEMQGNSTSEKAFNLDTDFAPKQESLSKSYDSLIKSNEASKSVSSNAPKPAENKPEKLVEANLLDDMPKPDFKPSDRSVVNVDDIFNENVIGAKISDMKDKESDKQVDSIKNTLQEWRGNHEGFEQQRAERAEIYDNSNTQKSGKMPAEQSKKPVEPVKAPTGRRR